MHPRRQSRTDGNSHCKTKAQECQAATGTGRQKSVTEAELVVRDRRLRCLPGQRRGRMLRVKQSELGSQTGVERWRVLYGNKEQSGSVSGQEKQIKWLDY